jgi:hypothetical protein
MKEKSLILDWGFKKLFKSAEELQLGALKCQQLERSVEVQHLQRAILI